MTQWIKYHKKAVTIDDDCIITKNSKELFKIYSKEKNREIRDILIERHLYLVNILSKKYINKGVEFDDIYQVASLALIYAIDRYDIEKGFEFSSFATPTIVGEIKKYFRDKVWTLRVPRRVQELSKKVSEAKVVLEQQNKKHPNVKEIAEYLDIKTTSFVTKEYIQPLVDAGKLKLTIPDKPKSKNQKYYSD